MKESKIKIEIEFDIEQYVEGVRISMTKDGKDIQGGDITVKELVGMYASVLVVKEVIERNAKDNGLSFEKALEGKKDKRGVLDRMLDWAFGR